MPVERIIKKPYTRKVYIERIIEQVASLCCNCVAWLALSKPKMPCWPKSSPDIFFFQVVEVFKDVPVERPVERVIEVVKEGIEFRRIYLSCLRRKTKYWLAC